MIGFIGLGKMGCPMAIHLQRAGHRIAVYGRNQEKIAPVLDIGAELFVDLPLLAGACEIIFTMVGTPDDVCDLYFGDTGLISNAPPNAILIDMTTSTSDVAKRIELACRDRNINALDAPVTGGVKGAETAQLTFMVGGAKAVLNRVRPYLDTMGALILHMGDAGSGQIAKSCNQVAVAGIVLGATEALILAAKNGIPADRMLQILNSGTGSSPLLTSLQNRLQDSDSPVFFTLTQFIKDLRIASAEARRAGNNTVAAEGCLEYCEEFDGASGSELGLHALLELYKRTQ